VIWYAAYGSNLSSKRFAIYLHGGTPDGSTHHYPGCRDASDPVDVRPFEIADLELAFGGMSQTWGGGVAFVRPADGARTKARLYLVTDEQFADVVAQENWLDPGSVGIDGGDYMYGEVPILGFLEGHEIRTITQAPDTELRPPSDRYLNHIAQGLREAHGMPDEAIETYLRNAPGSR